MMQVNESGRQDGMLFQYVTKVAVTSLLVVGVSEMAKRSTVAGAVLASLPLTSLLAFTWLYSETGDVQKVAALSHGIFWLVLASLPFFLVLPALLNAGWTFWASMGVAGASSFVAYLGVTFCLTRMGGAV
jgi:hypothetical protein